MITELLNGEFVPAPLFVKIYNAAKNGDTNTLDRIYKNNSTLEVRYGPHTPASKLAKEGNLEALKLLRKYPHDINLIALNLAQSEHIFEAEALLHEGADERCLAQGFAIAGSTDRAMALLPEAGDNTVSERRMEMINFIAEGVAIRGDSTKCASLVDRGASLGCIFSGALKGGHVTKKDIEDIEKIVDIDDILVYFFNEGYSKEVLVQFKDNFLCLDKLKENELIALVQKQYDETIELEENEEEIFKALGFLRWVIEGLAQNGYYAKAMLAINLLERIYGVKDLELRTDAAVGLIRAGYSQYTLEFLDQGANVDRIADALALNNQMDMVPLLIKVYKADVNRLANWFVWHDKIELALLLIRDYGASPKSVLSECYNDHFSVELLQLGFDINHIPYLVEKNLFVTSSALLETLTFCPNENSRMQLLKFLLILKENPRYSAYIADDIINISLNEILKVSNKLDILIKKTKLPFKLAYEWLQNKELRKMLFLSKPKITLNYTLLILVCLPLCESKLTFKELTLLNDAMTYFVVNRQPVLASLNTYIGTGIVSKFFSGFNNKYQSQAEALKTECTEASNKPTLVSHLHKSLTLFSQPNKPVHPHVLKINEAKEEPILQSQQLLDTKDPLYELLLCHLQRLDPSESDESSKHIEGSIRERFR